MTGDRAPTPAIDLGAAPSADPDAGDSFAARLTAAAVVPVLVIADPDRAVPLAEALLEGGLRCAEITFRTAAAAESIGRVRRHFPELLVGAGTVLSVAQADAALDAGAEFVVAPGTNLSVVDHVLGRGAPMLPGAMTPSEIEGLMARGVALIKFFPAEPAGGIPMLRALGGPYPGVRFVPTGGISLSNLGAYLALRTIAACGGSWMATAEQIAGADWAAIREASRRTVEAIRTARPEVN